ncbi:MAG: replication factor C large subunit [Candidatus Bathyarchaeota archaeon]|nr:replication factor C large subunit [Candidatus Bathyarchaeota archaeon]
MHAAWTVKHKPKRSDEIVGNREAVESLGKWLKSWEMGIPQRRAAFLHGAAGVGKTVTVEVLADELGFELIEKNASDYRTEEKIRQFAGLASQYSGLFGKRRIVLLDELDGIYGAVDRGAIPALTRIIKDTRCPIVLTANKFWDKRFVGFRDKRKFLILEFKKPSASQVFKLLKRICAKEGIAAEEQALKFVANRSEGDVRSAVNDLQSMAQGRKELTYDNVSWLAHRNRKDVIFNVIRLVLYGKDCRTAKQAIRMADVDLDMLFEWIYENTPYHFNVPSELTEAMTALATADLYRGRIRRTRNWKLMRYWIDFMTAGVAMARVKSKPSGWVPFRFPQRIKSLSASRLERRKKTAISKKIKGRMHVSTVVARKDILPYLKVIFENDFRMAAGLTDWFNFVEEEVSYIAGSKRQAKTILKHMAQ